MTDLPPARILEVSPDEYHKLPGLSPSLAGVMVSRCAEIARDQYVREIEETAAQTDDDDDNDDDGEAVTPVDAKKQKQLDRGSVCHALLLGVGKRIDVIPRSKLDKRGGYGTAASKELRNAARAAGRVPVKEPEMPAYERAIDAIRARLATAGHVLDGRSELAIEWWEPTRHGPVKCRTMMDHVRLFASDGLQATFPPEPPVTVRPAFAKIYEAKFPGDASPDRSERTANQLSYEIAAAARVRALEALFPSLAGRIEYRYLICEPHRPYAFWAPTPTGAFMEHGRRLWSQAVNTWAWGLSSGEWVGYHSDNGKQQIDLLRWVKLREGYPVDDE